MRRINTKLGGLLLFLALVWGCDDGILPGPDGQIPNEYQPGQTEFTSSEPNSNNGGNRFLSPGAQSDGATAEKDNSGVQSGAPQGRNAAVEEADIYRVDNNTLFYLNTYKGFVIYNLDDPKKPKRLSKLPVYGYPIEMFVSGKTVYALLRDALYLTQVDGSLKFERHNVSQLVAIDISDLTKPKVLKTIDIIGELREGVSRKIENTIYVVSNLPRYYYYGWGGSTSDQKEQAWVYSFNVADPKNPALVEKLQIFEGGSVDVQDPKTQSYYSRYFNNVTISATSNALMVVENWWKSSYSNSNTGEPSSGGGSTPSKEPAEADAGMSTPDASDQDRSDVKPWCGSYSSAQEAVVSIIDISDPQGKIKLHTKFQTVGQLSDQFKQTYIFDEKTQKGTYLGMFARQEWSSQNCEGSQLTKNTLEAWDISDGANPVQIDALDFGKPNETIRGSVFDAERRVAFAITAERIDPLYAISFADPANLKVESAVDGLSGDMNVFRFIGDKKFLLAIGRDNSETCTGFGDPSTGWWSANIAVSIIDVQDLGKIRLVQRQCVAVQNAQWVNSEINWNLDQAHKLIGMHSDEEANVITVPVSYWKENQQNDWYWGQYETAVGMMTWDLTAYDPTKSEKEQSVLQNFGTVVHPQGEVRRTIVFTHKGATEAQDRRKVLNLSDTHLSLVDIQDLKNPVSDSVVEIAPYVGQLLKFGDYIVEQTNPTGWYGSNQLTEFRIKKATGGAVLEDATPVATISVGQVERSLKFKENLVLFRRVHTKQQSAKDPNYFEDVWQLEAVIYDLSNPTAPKQVSATVIQDGWIPYYYYYCGVDAYWGGYWFDYSTNGWAATDNGFVFFHQTWDYQTQQSTSKLVHFDLSNVAKPQVVDYPLDSSTKWQYYSLIGDSSDPKGFFLVYRELLGEDKLSDGTISYQYKNFAERWGFNGTKFVPETPFNIPGWLIKTWSQDGKRMFLTHDYSYTQKTQDNYTYWQPNFRLHLLRQLSGGSQNVAELLDTHQFDDKGLAGLVLEKDKLFVHARPSYGYGWYGGGGIVKGGGVAVAEDSASSNVKSAAFGLDTPDQTDHLLVFDLATNKLDQVFSSSIGTYGIQVMGSYQDRLFVNLPGDGILVVNISDAAKPVGQQFLRTLGYASHIEFVGNTAFIASGYFGTYQMNLTNASSL